ncbi:alkaline phosphatase family protein [Nocardia sp. NPDC003482]
MAATFGLDYGNPLALTPNRDVVLLVIDGLGAEPLRRHRDIAPTLANQVTTTLMAGFPATTAASLTSLAVGAPCAAHGIIGYSFAVPDPGGLRVLNALRWRLDAATGPDASDSHPPETMQHRRSRLQDLAAHGVEVHYVIPGYQGDSGLTRAAFRATGTMHPASTLAEVRAGILAVATHSDASSRFAYAYFGDLDAAGHLHGPESEAWRTVLREVDACVADLLTDLPSACTLLVTGDHGMIEADAVLDLDSRGALHRGVRLIAGESRVRHIHLEHPDALADVMACWTGELGQHARIVSREQALDEHWFGRMPPDPVVRGRIGDLIAVAEGRSVLIRSEREPLESTMIGHHGAWTADEQLVPLITAGGDRGTPW